MTFCFLALRLYPSVDPKIRWGRYLRKWYLDRSCFTSIKSKQFVPDSKKRNNDVWLKILLGTWLEESLKAKTRDGAEKSEKIIKKIMNVLLIHK